MEYIIYVLLEIILLISILYAMAVEIITVFNS